MRYATVFNKFTVNSADLPFMILHSHTKGHREA